MLKRFRACVAGLFLVGVVLTPSAARAAPGASCEQTDPWTGVCLVWVQTDPGAEAGAGNDQTVSGAPVADTNPCSYQLAEPQPATTHPVWAGHLREDGA